MDYLCELPNDRARLLALDSLPPNLFETYERILERIMARSDYVQKIVERTLRWTLGAIKPLTTSQLLEAITIETDEHCFDEYAKIEEEDVFRNCSCLVRKTADARSVELAHFTVEEFLKALDPLKSPRIARFANLRRDAAMTLGQTCLAYLNYDEFVDVKVQDLFWRSAHPFWTYAATCWHEHADDEQEDSVTQSLLHRFFHPTISPYFVLWNRYIWLDSHGLLPERERKVVALEEMYREWKASQFEYVDSIIPLHHAASLASEKLTQWLLSNGSDPNKTSIMGTPLECALHSKVADNPEIRGIKKILSNLIKSGADVCLASETNESLLALAIKTENPELIKLFLQAGAIIDKRCIEMINDRMSRKRSSGRALPAFLESISYEDVPDSIKPDLIDLALNYRSTTKKALSMLENSSVTFSENAELLDLTLQDAALRGQFDVVAKTIPFLINSINSRNGEQERTALHCASMNGHYDVVCLLLDNGADVNVQDKEGSTPAHLCIDANVDQKVLQSLIEHGAKLSIVNGDQMSLLHVAAQSSRPDVLRFLLNKDSTHQCRVMRAKTGMTLPMCALASNNRSLEMIQLAGDATPISECLAGNDDGQTGLHLATKLNDSGCMKYFLDKGNLNEQTNDGSTALHLAFLEGDAETAKLLLDRGAEICTASNDGFTPLHLAASSYLSDLDAVLSAQGVEAIINRKNEYGRAAIHITINQQYFNENTVEMMSKLLEVPGVDVNVTDADNATPLILLAMGMGTQPFSQQELYNAFKLLLSRNADLDRSDKAGSTALHHLCGMEITESVASAIELLLDKDADVLAPNQQGSLAVEILLQNVEFSDKQAEGMGNFQISTLRRIFKRIPDQKFNTLHRGWTRPFVLSLQYKAQALAEELAPRTSDVDLSYAEYTPALCPLDACCAYECDFRIFEMLASRSKDLSKINEQGSSLLHLACLYNKHDVLAYLLARKVDLEVEDGSGSTPLNLSMTYGRSEMMEMLLVAGANPSHLNRGTSTLWHIAASSPSPEVLNKLFQKGKIVELEVRNTFGYTPLMCAIANSRKENLETLLAKDSKLDAKDNMANGVLHLAAMTGRFEILKILIHKGISKLNDLNGQGQTPLLLAAANGHHTLVSILLEAGGDPHVKDENGQSLVHHVALNGQTGILTRLKSENVAFDLEDRNNLGRTPLLCAAEKGHALMVSFLLDEGANIHAVGTDGFGLLHVIAYYGSASVMCNIFHFIESLGYQRDERERVINIDSSHPTDGNTPLGIAAIHGHLAAFETLVGEGASLTKPNNEGWNPLHLAVMNKRYLIIKALFDHCELWNISFDINAKDKKGRTALMLLGERGTLKGRARLIEKLLMGKGAERLESCSEKEEDKKRTEMEEKEWWESCGGFCNIDGV